MSITKKNVTRGIRIKPDDVALEGKEGELKVGATSKEIEAYLDGASRTVVTEDQSQVLTNKGINADDNSISELEVDNLKLGVLNTDVELDGASDSQIPSALAVKTFVESRVSEKDEADEIAYDNSGSDLVATDVQAAIDEVDANLDAEIIRATSAESTLQSNIDAEKTRAELAEAGLQQAIVDEEAARISGDNTLQGNINSVASDLSTETSERITADNNLQSQIDTKAEQVDLNSHTSATEAHGATGAVVGTTNVQTLTNKTLTAPVIDNGSATGTSIISPERLDVKQGTRSSLNAYAVSAQNGQIVYATDTKEYLAVKDGVLVSVGGGLGDLDVVFQDDFETSQLSDYTQTGLALSTSSPLHGRISALLTHDSVSDRSFKRTFAVDPKYRDKNITLKLDIDSTADQGNVVLTVRDETSALNLVTSEQLLGAQPFVSFDLPANCLSISYEIVALPQAGSPTTKIDDIVAYITKVNEYTAVVQEPDSVLVAQGNAGQAITNNVTPIPFTFVSLKGSAISYGGSQVTVNDDGVYKISLSAYFTTSVQRAINLFVNGVNSKRISTAVSTNAHTAEIVEEFKKGDVLTFLTEGNGGTLQSSFGDIYHYLRVVKQGSLKVANVNKNSKITIPTSELRMEGASSRGSTATAIVRFDSVAKLRGDAFEVVSNAVDGTYVRMKKAGRLDAQATVTVGANFTFGISKNQTTLTSTPPAAESIAIQSNSTAFNSSISGTTYVVAGDIIRVSASGTPSGVNFLSLSFQEQEIQVSVSNTLPQFSESDSCVRLDTSNGHGSTGTTVARFSNIRQNIGTDIGYEDSPTLGSSFTVRTAGIYGVSYSRAAVSGTARSMIAITVNSSQLSTSADSISVENVLARSYHDSGTNAEINTAAWSGYLAAGDIIRPQTDGVAEQANFSNFTISKVGKPNVTGVDVTPFVNIPQPESQNTEIVVSGIATASSNLQAGVLVSKGSGLYSISDGVITALKHITIDVFASRTTSYSTTAGNYTAIINILKNQVLITREVNAVRDWYSGLGSSFAVSTSSSVVLAPGETLSFSGTDTVNTGSVSNVFTRIQITATALSDQILTEPETFSTDTATLVYAPSSLYTLSTLANAPVGTFITFTYAASSNARTQTTTAPTQSVADMNVNGIQIFTRAYNAASTAGNPAAIAIQIGKGLKGKSLDLYKSIGKVTNGSTDFVVFSSNASENGIRFKDYNELTGVLYIDMGVKTDNVVTSHNLVFSDLTGQNNGYLVINASKNPALTGINSNIVSARMVNTAGTSIAATDTKIPFDATASILQNIGIEAPNHRIVASESGIYDVCAAIQFASALYAAGNQIAIRVYKNGSLYSTLAMKTVDAAVTAKQGIEGQDQIRLSKGDYVEFFASNGRGATALSTTAGECYMSVSKKGGI
jgi:hypothetical protein